MGIRTGAQYLAKLNAMHPHVVIDGEVVSENIAEHPAFRNVARTYAKLFDMQHDLAHQDALTYTSPTTGDRVGASWSRGLRQTCSTGVPRSGRGRSTPMDSWAGPVTI